MTLLEAHIAVLEQIRKDVDSVLAKVPETAAREGWPQSEIERVSIELEARKRSLAVAIDHLRRVQG